MITLITAVPGSGKTLLAVGLVYKYNLEKRSVFHNIAGLQVDKFPNPELIHDAPADWRDTPHGSVVVYDECQQPHLYPATAQRGTVSDERLTAMETHRHSGHDLILELDLLIDQALNLVQNHISGIPADMMAILQLMGFTTGLSMLASAMVTAVALKVAVNKVTMGSIKA